MEGLDDLFVRSKLSSRAHCPLLISNVTTKKCNLMVLYWSSIYKSIIWKLNKMSSCQTRMKPSHLITMADFVLKLGHPLPPLWTSPETSNWPWLNFRETTYGVYQIFICIGGQYLIKLHDLSSDKMNTIHVGIVLIAMYCFDSAKDILASSCVLTLHCHRN